VSEGFVYILTNAAMPGYIKVGLTRQDDVASRVKQLDNTSLPLPFECYFAARVPDCARLERTLHFVFGEKRARGNREFFTADPDVVKAIIELVALENVSPSDSEQAITPVQRSAINDTRARAERRNFPALGITTGATLTFTKDPTITCTVSGDRSVRFEGADMSVSGAAMIVIRRMGYNWPSVPGFDYWEFDGVKLSNIAMPEPDSTTV
jgi:hypothetical protein